MDLGNSEDDESDMSLNIKVENVIENAKSENFISTSPKRSKCMLNCGIGMDNKLSDLFPIYKRDPAVTDAPQVFGNSVTSKSSTSFTIGFPAEEETKTEQVPELNTEGMSASTIASQMQPELEQQNIPPYENAKTPQSVPSIGARYSNFSREQAVTTERYDGYRCLNCNRIFTSYKTLVGHAMICTKSKAPKECSSCHKLFSRAHDLKRHMWSHTGEKPYGSKECNKEFTCAETLKQHKRSHTGQRQFACQICIKEFVNASKLKAHIRCHTGERPFECNICKKAFAQSGHLRRHEIIHTGEKNYVCNICYKAYSSGTNLKVHMRTHTGEKPYLCNICNKAMATSYELVTHKRTHTGEKPYECNICNKAFSQGSHLKMHIKTHDVGKLSV